MTIGESWAQRDTCKTTLQVRKAVLGSLGTGTTGELFWYLSNTEDKLGENEEIRKYKGEECKRQMRVEERKAEKRETAKRRSRVEQRRAEKKKEKEKRVGTWRKNKQRREKEQRETEKRVERRERKQRKRREGGRAAAAGGEDSIISIQLSLWFLYPKKNI